jgi:hypothetical protein
VSVSEIGEFKRRAFDFVGVDGARAPANLGEFKRPHLISPVSTTCGRWFRAAHGRPATSANSSVHI